MSAEYNPKSNVIFGDVDLSDYYAFAVYCNIFDRPERDVEVVSVPGRNGDLIFDNGRYKNLDRVYTIQVTGVANAQNLITALSKTLGYQELSDDYDTTVYYMARIKSRPRIAQFVGNAVLLTVTFDRKPQRWLTSGKTTPITGTYIGRLTDSSSGREGVMKLTINNTTEETLLPRIYVPGDQVQQTWGFDLYQSNTDMSTPTVAGLGEKVYSVSKAMVATDAAGYVEIDSEERTTKHGTNATYPDISESIIRFPTIPPGTSYMYFVFVGYNPSYTPPWTGLKSPKLYARWWTI